MLKFILLILLYKGAIYSENAGILLMGCKFYYNSAGKGMGNDVYTNADLSM
jgi:hypothetical protein